jgi:hypothetical protein
VAFRLEPKSEGIIPLRDLRDPDSPRRDLLAYHIQLMIQYGKHMPWLGYKKDESPEFFLVGSNLTKEWKYGILFDSLLHKIRTTSTTKWDRLLFDYMDVLNEETKYFLENSPLTLIKSWVKILESFNDDDKKRLMTEDINLAYAKSHACDNLSIARDLIALEKKELEKEELEKLKKLKEQEEEQVGGRVGGGVSLLDALVAAALLLATAAGAVVGGCEWGGS